MGRRFRKFLHSHQRKPEKTSLFLLKLKRFESISSFDTSRSKYFRIWDNDAALPDAVSASSVDMDYSFQKCLFEIILKIFFQDFVLQSRNLLIVIHAWRYLFLLFDCLKAIFRPLLRGQPDLTDINRCIFNLSTTQNSPVVHVM